MQAMLRGVLGATRIGHSLFPRVCTSRHPSLNVARCSTLSWSGGLGPWEKLPLKIVCMDVHFDPLPELMPPGFDKNPYLVFFRQSKLYVAARTTEEGPTSGRKNFFDVDDEPNTEYSRQGGVILQTNEAPFTLSKRLRMHDLHCRYFPGAGGLERTMHDIQAQMMRSARGLYWRYSWELEMAMEEAADATVGELEPLRLLSYCCSTGVGLREIEESWRRPIDPEKIRAYVNDFV